LKKKNGRNYLWSFWDEEESWNGWRKEWVETEKEKRKRRKWEDWKWEKILKWSGKEKRVLIYIIHSAMWISRRNLVTWYSRRNAQRSNFKIQVSEVKNTSQLCEVKNTSQLCNGHKLLSVNLHTLYPITSPLDYFSLLNLATWLSLYNQNFEIFKLPSSVRHDPFNFFYFNLNVATWYSRHNLFF
jgi:hypothetical protein